MNIQRFNTKQFYYGLLAIVLVGFAIDVFLFATSGSSAAVMTQFSESKDLSSAYTPSTGLTLKDLPTVHNLPITISWSQTLKIREYLNQQVSTEANKDATFRDNSLTTTTDGTSFLIDAPTLKKTLLVGLFSDGNLSIGCGAAGDQKDATWTCTNTSEVSE